MSNLHPGYRAVFASDASEHAVEVILLFLQAWLSDFKIIPIVIGRGVNTEAWVSALEKILDGKAITKDSNRACGIKPLLGLTEKRK